MENKIFNQTCYCSNAIKCNDYNRNSILCLSCDYPKKVSCAKVVEEFDNNEYTNLLIGLEKYINSVLEHKQETVEDLHYWHNYKGDTPLGGCSLEEIIEDDENTILECDKDLSELYLLKDKIKKIISTKKIEKST